MAKPKRAKKQGGKAIAVEPVPRGLIHRELAKKPLSIARVFSAALLLVGVVMLILGGGVLSGRIADGWGFPMSAVSNWGRPWGLVLMVAGTAYVVCPVLLFLKPQKGTVVMMVLSGLSVLIGTPLITTTTEIFYNLFQETKSRPDWVDSIWGYFMIVNVAVAIAVYRAQGGNVKTSKRQNVETSTLQNETGGRKFSGP